MFGFLKLFKRKQFNAIPTIKPTAIHKKDDKKGHDLFLVELENLLVRSKLFKAQYIQKYISLYKSYKAFMRKDSNLLGKQPFFLESLSDDALQFKNNEIRKYSKNIVLIANRRAMANVTLERFKKDNLFDKVILYFPENKLICETMLTEKSKYHKKIVTISKAPIFPLITCVRCNSCHLGISYKPYIKI